MAANQPDPKLRFDAGSYEESMIGLILFLQYILGAMLVIMTLGWAYFTLNAVLDSNRSGTYLFGAIPVLIGMVVALSILNLLYEFPE